MFCHMSLIEDKYTPKKLSELLSPNSKELINILMNHVKTENMNILFIGSIYTFKTQAMKLVLNEYYGETHKEYVLIIDCFTDINFSGNINELKTFCKSNSKIKKCVFIDNFDIINDANQQYFKKIMDNSPNVFFLFGCENTSKIGEIIQTRMTPIFFENLTNTEYSILIDMISKGEGITIDNIDLLLNCSYLSIYYIYNLFNKFVLLGLKHVTDIKKHIILLDDKILDRYFKFIHSNQVKESTAILFELFEKGYSLLDIYYFIYEYLKLCARGINYLYIEKVCYYINHIYEGYDTKIMLLFFSNELCMTYKNRNVSIYGS